MKIFMQGLTLALVLFLFTTAAFASGESLFDVRMQNKKHWMFEDLDSEVWRGWTIGYSAGVAAGYSNKCYHMRYLAETIIILRLHSDIRSMLKKSVTYADVVKVLDIVEKLASMTADAKCTRENAY